MKSADRLTMVLLADIAAVVADLERLYPEAVASAESVRVSSQQTGVAVRSSRISDPTADAALDPRRQRRASNVKQGRKAIRRANAAVREAMAHVNLAVDH